MSNRKQEMERLRFRYLVAVDQGKRKQASILYARLSALVLRELKAENRAQRKLERAAA